MLWLYVGRTASRVRGTPASFQLWIMASLLYRTTTLFLLSLVMTEAYHAGPPVDSEICKSMSPRAGHPVEPKSSPAPFEIRILTTSNCYKVGEPITGNSPVLLICFAWSEVDRHDVEPNLRAEMESGHRCGSGICAGSGRQRVDISLSLSIREYPAVLFGRVSAALCPGFCGHLDEGRCCLAVTNLAKSMQASCVQSC